MNQEGISVRSSVSPNQFVVNKRPDGISEISYNENITAISVTDGEGTHQEYESTAYSDVTTASTYSHLVEALIALKYSTGDEFSLNRKASTDAEYKTYIAYVEACKTFAKSYYGIA